MKREGTIGAAALLTLAAVVGVSFLPSSRPPGGENAHPKGSATIAEKKEKADKGPGEWCDELQSRLKNFLEVKNDQQLDVPDSCYPDPANKDLSKPIAKPQAAQLKFVIAILPDPLHTHLPVLFDELTIAIQEGAQDEKYEFDGSWLPWEDQEKNYTHLDDQDQADDRKEKRENQPGIILFRGPADADTSKTPDKPAGTFAKLSPQYSGGLIVFVVGEDATHGLHRAQFRNALAWINKLNPQVFAGNRRPAILGPTFSGSLASLAQILQEGAQDPNRDPALCPQVAIFSGSVSAKDPADRFVQQFSEACAGQPPPVFHSFVQSDQTMLNRFCRYMHLEQPYFDPHKLAIVSEDETAYGIANETPDTSKGDAKSAPDLDYCGGALHLFYPRDISALRGAYQTSSIFSSGGTAQSAESSRQNLPSDLADPAGEVHDSIKSYGGNQTPLTQEALLLQLSTTLRVMHARYVVISGTNSLDQIFLTDFLHRTYPDARIIITAPDLLFARERGSTSLGGTMTLSTYPLAAEARRWASYPKQWPSDRVFSADVAEGSYIALRLLLNEPALKGDTAAYGCHLDDRDRSRMFLPHVICDSPADEQHKSVVVALPDYNPPYWLTSGTCVEPSCGEPCPYEGPPTWLSAIAVNRFWPLAALNESTIRRELPAEMRGHTWPPPGGALLDSDKLPGRRPEMPLEMRIFWVLLIVFASFQAWCCWKGSFTRKPSFRAHFACVDCSAHEWLVLAGSSCVAFLGIETALSCAALFPPAYQFHYPLVSLACGIVVCALALTAMGASCLCHYRLSKDRILNKNNEGPHRDLLLAENRRSWWLRGFLYSSCLLVLMLLFLFLNIPPVAWTPQPANHVLALWRSMHLTAGISWLVPMLAVLAGFYAAVWFLLHGLALFGPDRPLLPRIADLQLQEENHRYVMKMFSREEAAEDLEKLCRPFNLSTGILALCLFVAFIAVAWAMNWGYPAGSLGQQRYFYIVMLWLDLCCSLLLAETWRLLRIWRRLKTLLAFLDRLPLRRTMAALHGFSWGSVWKMSGNVLEVRYEFLSRQIECMNHTITSLSKARDTQKVSADRVDPSIKALLATLGQVMSFADWYAENFNKRDAGYLEPFRCVQLDCAETTGLILSTLLVPVWFQEGTSLLQTLVKEKPDEPSPDAPPPSKKEWVRNAEEFVCLTYLAFIQNVLGRLRTVSLTIVALFLAATVALSSYPFDPREALSGFLVVILVLAGTAIFNVYAEMHRDATLSHVTNTNPGELGTDFWVKLLGFGFAPVVGLVARIFPSVSDFLFSWLQPSISSLK